MKNKFAQFALFINKFDRRHLQTAYLVLMIAVGVILRSPSDGGTGPF